MLHAGAMGYGLWAPVLALVATSGCDTLFGLEGRDVRDAAEPEAPNVRFCDRPEQANATFCADFDDPLGGDDPTNVLRQFMRLDNLPNERYEVDLDLPRSIPRAARLAISGTGSPDARLYYPLNTANHVSLSLWVHIKDDDVNDVKLAQLRFLPNQSTVFVMRSGLLRENVGAMPQVTRYRFAGAVIDTWFEITFDVNPATRTVVVTFAGEQRTLTLADTAEAMLEAFQFGPADPQTENATNLWSILFDDIVVRP